MSESGIRRNVDKLGHVLEEVRERALLHLNTKLVHGLVTLEDLNKCPGFARRLLGKKSKQSFPTFQNKNGSTRRIHLKKCSCSIS